MENDESQYALPIALAALQLTFHGTKALLDHGLLSPAKRQECAQALRELHFELHRIAGDPDIAFPHLQGVRELIELLSAP